MAARSAIPIIILTGFLGSGKTTLLAKWMRAPEFSRTMVIVNEMGEVGIDSHLMQASSEAPVMLDNGCACCEGAENLNATLERLFWDRLHRRIAPYDWVIIETSGAADPGALIASLAANPVVRERYALAAVVSVFDAAHGPALLERRSECASQILHADCVILSKADTASASEIAMAQQAVQTRNKHAVLLPSSQGDAPAGAIAQLARLQHADANTARQSGRFAHHGGLSQFFATTPTQVVREHLTQALAAVLADYSAHLLRIKGFLLLAAQEQVIVQWAPGAVAVQLADSFPGNADQIRSGLIFIAEDNQAETIAKAFLARLSEMTAAPVAKVRPQETLRHAS